MSAPAGRKKIRRTARNMRGVMGSLPILSDLDIKNYFYKEKTLCLCALVVHEIFGLKLLMYL
jgi:hypothetical protein